MAASLSALLKTVDEQLLHPDEGDFVGREFVRADIKQFLAIKNSMLVLVGSQGVGKTALAAQLVREHLGDRYPYLAHFCGLSGNDNPFVFCSALASLLEQLLGEGYTLPETAKRQQIVIQNSLSIGQAGSGAKISALTLNIGGMHPREAFRQLVREPLRVYNEKYADRHADNPLLIVIDGLERAWDWDGGQDGNILSVLADAQDLPPWINLICLARPGPAVRALRAQAGVRVIDLLNERSPQIDNDMRTFLSAHFLEPLPDNARGRFNLLIAGQDMPGSAGIDHVHAFIEKTVAASEGNFLFVRRYVDAWKSALFAADGGADKTSALLAFDKGTLSSMLDDTYADTLAQLQSAMEGERNDTDEAVLAALAIAFAPLDIGLLACITAKPRDAVTWSLNHSLNPVLEPCDGDPCTYALYHRGFADYVRRSLESAARRWDVDAANRLDQASDDDALLRDYRARYRWSHLLRGLDLSTSTAIDADRQSAALAQSSADVDRASAGNLENLDPITHAQLLRALATRALDPAPAEPALSGTAAPPGSLDARQARTARQQAAAPVGSWTAALNSLKSAMLVLQHSRALSYTRRRGWRFGYDAPVSPELIELERTLIATGDAYATIARRMDGRAQRPGRPGGAIGALLMIWDLAVRLPLTLYLLLVLLFQGVREIHIPGALQNLGRAQDWTVARLCVLSVSAYRRARWLAHNRGDDESAAAIHERLARVYTQMGAYDAAASSYEALLARPASIARPWRQAVWRLALGEVLVAQGQADQAVEVLSSALLVFEAQQTPIQRARALSALATAHHLRANAADRRRDGRLAGVLDQEALDTCDAALQAWRDVTTLQGDESASVDPALAISNVAHQLWWAERSARLADEQRRSARRLLDTIPERHYPQRFEHPVLRLFRISAAVLLPAYVLAGLLLAIQIPNGVQVQTQTDLEFPPPLVDLTRFPNDQISGRASALNADEARAFSPVNLTKLANSTVTLQPGLPRLDPLGTTKVLLLILGAYLTFYTLFGLAVVTLSSPAQFQNRRPGRLILQAGGLGWRGPAGQGSLVDALVWMRQDVRWVAGHLLRPIAGLLRRTTQTSAIAQTAPDRVPGDVALAFAEIGEVISVDRSAFGYLARDFSFTLVQPRSAARRPIVLPGTMLHYEELCDELELRLHRPRRHFGVEIIRSWWGICFLLTLAYALALVVLLPMKADLLARPLPLASYSLANLYVIAAPGLLIPLLWWFVAKRLGAECATSSAALALAATAIAAGVLTAGVWSGQADLAMLGMRPDLATPILAAGLLIALVFHAPPRDLFARRTATAAAIQSQPGFAPASLVFRRLGISARVLLALLALGGLVLIGWRISTTLRWYNAIVQGNRMVAQALSPGGCGDPADGCSLLDDAVRQYTNVICLRPGDSEGYAFRGFTRLAQRNYAASRDDFERALGLQAPGDSCAAGVIPRPSTAQQISLHANMGAVETLLARQPPLAQADMHYQEALRNYGLALGLDTDDQSLGCWPMALNLLRQAESVDTVLANDLPAPDPSAIEPSKAPIVLQLADACYSRGSARIEALSGPVVRQSRGTDRETARQAAWRELAAAIAEYSAVAANRSVDLKDRNLAQHGVAASWLALSHIDRPPVGAPDHNTALLRAMQTFQALEQDDPDSVNVFTGHAWTSIQLNAWGNAAAPLAAARERDPNDPTYPALQGLVAWLNSTQYPPPKKGAASAGYTTAISNALGLYSDVIAIGKTDMARAYATRSLLYFSLRNSPRGDTYQDEDYGAWMHLAITDADQALLAAQRSGISPERQVGYRYWRARLSFALALTWQEKTRGLHDWSELVTLYSSAYEDFSQSAAIDLNPERRKIFQDSWIPWCRALLANATHMQLARDAVLRNDFARARGELALIDPNPALVSKWDALSAPLPDYHYMHGLISLGLSLPDDFPNPLVKDASISPGKSAGEASYDKAIATTEDADIVPQPHGDYPDDSRPALYRAAIADLNRLLATPPTGWKPEARAAATRIRAQLQKQLAAVGG